MRPTQGQSGLHVALGVKWVWRPCSARTFASTAVMLNFVLWTFLPTKLNQHLFWVVWYSCAHFYVFPALKIKKINALMLLSHSLNCKVHQSQLLNTDTKITKFWHQVDSIWFGLFCYLKCTDGFNIFAIFFLIREVRKIGPARTPGTHNPIKPSRWLWKAFGNVINSHLFFSFNSLTGIGTNTSLNQQCPTVIVMKLSLMPTSFI